MKTGLLKFFPGCSHCFVAVSVLLMSIAAFGQAEADPWLILASSENGSISAHTTREDLVRRFGAVNVVDKDVDVGEGETTKPGTIVFPKDPQRTIEILWKDPDKKTLPASAQIAGPTSRWKTARNISLGTSLKELEQLNGQPFHLAGFGWDYSGTVMSWDKGALAQELGEAGGAHGRTILRLDYSSESKISDDEVSQVLGDQDFSSHHPVMQKLNPKVYQLIWEFP